jgi:hypothetical protein
MVDNDTRVTDTDAVYMLLADRDRRAVLEYLGANGGTATVLELARRISDSAGRMSESKKGDPRVRLHHVQLPKLAAAGTIDYDRGAKAVTLTACGRRLERIRRETVSILGSE